MQWRNSDSTWGTPAKVFHWLLALLIFAMIVLGWWAELAPLSPGKFALFTYHKTLGICVFVLMVLRLGWRLVNPTPILPPSLKGWERLAAQTKDVLLYAVLLGMPISGYVITSAANFPIDFLGLFEVPLIVPPSEETSERAKTLHAIGFWLLAALLVVHISAALRHHFILRDEILRRMLPGAGQ